MCLCNATPPPPPPPFPRTGLFDSLLRVFQQPFESMRLAHYMRRYAAHDQVQVAALASAARTVEATLKVLLAVQDPEVPPALKSQLRMVVELTLLCWCCPACRGAGYLSTPLSLTGRVNEKMLAMSCSTKRAVLRKKALQSRLKLLCPQPQLLINAEPPTGTSLMVRVIGNGSACTVPHILDEQGLASLHICFLMWDKY